MFVPRGVYGGGRLASFRLVVLKFTNIVLLKDVLLVLPISSLRGIPAPFRRTLFATASTMYIAKLMMGSDKDC